MTDCQQIRRIGRVRLHAVGWVKIPCAACRSLWSGNTPPTDLLQYIPHDAPRADVLSLGCGDLRDVMFSILLHGRRQKKLSFMLNDWEPAIHARNLILLQMVLDSRSLLQECGYADEVDGIIHEMGGVGIQGNDATNASENTKKSSAAKAGAGAPFATRIGDIFR